MARIRFALRSLAKAPLLSLVVVLSLGLGIGANTAIFSLLHQVVLRSLPVQKPEQLALVTSPGDFKDGRSSTNDSGGSDYIFSYPLFRELESQAQGPAAKAVAGIAGFRDFGGIFAFRGQTVPGTLMMVSGGYFPVLGVKPLLGRTIAPEDDRTGGGNPVALLGYGYWRDKLGAPLDVLNQSIRVNGQPFTIVGVAPPGFQSTTLGQQPDVYVPLAFKASLTPNWDGTKRWDDYWIYLVTRVNEGVSRAQVAAALDGPYRGWVDRTAKTSHWREATVKRFRETKLGLLDGRQGHSSIREDNRTPLFILMGATGMVLLIAMANAANLLLARSAQRKRELAIRAAMGASRGELVGQLLTEALLLAVGGALAGIVLGAVTLRLLVMGMSGDSPLYALSTQLEWPVLLFATALSLATGLLFGLYPSFEGSAGSAGLVLKNESGQASATKSTARVRQVLVAVQIMIAAALLVPTGLFLKSLVNLLHVDLGIQSDNVVTFRIAPALNGYKPEQSRALFDRLETELAAIPGVRGVADASVPLIAGHNNGGDVQIEGASAAINSNNPNSMVNEVGPGYFGKLGIPLIAGREFTQADTLGAPKVTIVNQQFVKNFLEGRNPIGLHISDGSGKPDIEIIGVARDSHYAGVKQKIPNVYFRPWRQNGQLNDLSFYLRAALPPAQIVSQVRRVVASLDRDLPPENLRTLDEQIRRNIQSERLVMQLAAAFAVLATSLAMLGLYGVMAHSVTRRTREIGIRIALGAAPVRIRLMVLRELSWILGAGLIAGIPAALLLARLTQSQLYGVKADDVLVVAGAALALGAAAMAAGYLPARRASRVNPLEALRYE